MIDEKLFTVRGLLDALLSDAQFKTDMHGDTWRKYCEIIPDESDARGKKIVVVRCREAYLRYSKGPKQGFFWDMYGDDMMTPEMALVALLHLSPALPRRPS